jgi:hypothetical protein
MTKLLKLFSFIFLFTALLQGNLFGQLSVFGGASLPAGAFGGTIITDPANNDSFAKLGFNLGLQNEEMINNYLYWTTTAILSVNSVNTSEMESQDYKIQPGGQVKFDSRSYFTYWLLSGFGIESSNSNNANMFFSAQVGVLFSKRPDMKITYLSMTTNQSAKLATAFALSFTSGIKLSHIILTARYCYGNPKYKIVSSSAGQSYNSNLSAPVSIIVFDISFVL